MRRAALLVGLAAMALGAATASAEDQAPSTGALRFTKLSEAGLSQFVTEVDGYLTVVNQTKPFDCATLANGFLFTRPKDYQRYVEAKKKLREELSEEEADKLFKFLKNQSQIPFRYGEDGCYARAHEMARLLELNGIDCRKVFAIGDLNVKTDWTPERSLRWWYHVAPLVKVRRKDGVVGFRVLDPAIFERPRSLIEWMDAMELKKCSFDDPPKPIKAFTAHQPGRCIVTPKYIYSPTEIGKSIDHWRSEDFISSERVLNQFIRISQWREEQIKKGKPIWPEPPGIK